MQTQDMSPESLVPPRRLGNLLAKARLTGGFSLEEASAALGEPWSPLTLLEVETGRRPLLDSEISALADLYDIRTSTLIPKRSQLTVDISEGTLAVGGRTVRFEQARAQRIDVLSRYLSLVYAMRDVTPGNPVPLRLPDLEVLEDVFAVPRRSLEDELRELMVDSSGSVRSRTRRLRGRLLVPIIGVVVAATTAGTLLLVSDAGGSEAPKADGDTPKDRWAHDGVLSAAASGAPVEIGEAVVQERLPDGTPGPVVPRS